jgi:hypothetical protein
LRAEKLERNRSREGRRGVGPEGEIQEERNTTKGTIPIPISSQQLETEFRPVFALHCIIA